MWQEGRKQEEAWGGRRGGGDTQAQRKAISLEGIPFVGVGVYFFSYSETNRNRNYLLFLFSMDSIPKCAGETGWKINGEGEVWGGSKHRICATLSITCQRDCQRSLWINWTLNKSYLVDFSSRFCLLDGVFFTTTRAVATWKNHTCSCHSQKRPFLLLHQGHASAPCMDLKLFSPSGEASEWLLQHGLDWMKECLLFKSSFFSVELFEQTKAQKNIFFRFVCHLAKNIAPFLVKRPVSSQHVFGRRPCVCVFRWSKMLNSGDIPVPLFMAANHSGSDFSLHGWKDLRWYVLAKCQAYPVMLGHKGCSHRGDNDLFHTENIYFSSFLKSLFPVCIFKNCKNIIFSFFFFLHHWQRTDQENII